MDRTQYVQHLSGQGNKWLVHHEGPTDYQVLGESLRALYLPKSEYRPCAPPVKVWIDVTRTVSIQDEGRHLCLPGTPDILYTMPPGYRWGYHADERNRYGLDIHQQQEK
jgi:hypothetical protein